jgi:hypothetical protein
VPCSHNLFEALPARKSHPVATEASRAQHAGLAAGRMLADKYSMAKIDICSAIAAVSFLLAPSRLPAADRIATGKWTVEFADDQCLMSRQFGTAEDPLILIIRQMPMADESTLFIMLKSDDTDYRTGKGSLQFDGQHAPVEEEFSAVSLSHDKLRKISFSLNDDQLALAEKAGRAAISFPGEVVEAFQLSNLAAVRKLGQKCAVELGQEWGFSAAEQSRIVSPPDGDVVQFVKSGDYPEDAIRNDEQGQVMARATVDAKGKPADCTIVNSSGSDSLDDTTARSS